MILGPVLYGTGSTAGWVNALYKGDGITARSLQALPPQHMVHVRDVALLHLAALLEPDVRGERLLAYAEPYNYASLVSAIKTIDPSKTFLKTPTGRQGEDLSVVDTRRGTELLQRYGRASGFAGLEATLRDQVAFCGK
jgi:nucleoside-diphosphate-sugar epimerase